MFKSDSIKKTRFFRVLSLALVVSLFINVGYVNATSITCYSSGDFQINFESKHSCCQVQYSDIATISGKCCDTEKIQKIYDSYSSSEDFENVVPTAIVAVNIEAHERPIDTVEKPLEISLKSPPKAAIVSISVLFSVFRI